MSSANLPERTFIAPTQRNIHEQYTAKVDIITEPKSWQKVHVSIIKHDEDGTEDVIFEYDRNYAMMKTFEPFRQLKNNVWHDYALISTEYTRFEVVDLEKGQIIATESYPIYTQDMHDACVARGGIETREVGQEMPGVGFCPTAFKVFDWRERFNDESMTKTYTPYKATEPELVYSDEKFYAYSGQWAIYSGCIWGDDSGWKVRYIDLSRISEGIVTSDERFGYLQLAGGLDQVDYYSDDDRFTFPIEISTSRSTGKSYPIYAEWEEED